MNIKTPTGWRKGQTIFNFLEWLRIEKGIDEVFGSSGGRMAAPFHLSDKLFDKYWIEFINLRSNK